MTLNIVYKKIVLDACREPIFLLRLSRRTDISYATIEKYVRALYEESLLVELNTKDKRQRTFQITDKGLSWLNSRISYS